MKFKLILMTVLAFGSMAYAQGFTSNLSIGVGFEGIFPAATFTQSTANTFGAANTQYSTKSVGYVGDFRYDFGRHSAFDLSATYNRASENFLLSSSAAFSSGFIEHVPSNIVEVIGTYVFRLPSNEHVKPYAEFGGGFVRFSPVANASTTAGIAQSQSKPAFAYGFGTDFKMSDKWSLRLQYRGLLRSSPDYGLLNNASNPFGSGLKTHVPEPSIMVVYHF